MQMVVWAALLRMALSPVRCCSLPRERVQPRRIEGRRDAESGAIDGQSEPARHRVLLAQPGGGDSDATSKCRAKCIS